MPSDLTTRIFRIPGTPYRGEDIAAAEAVCTASRFRELADGGFNGIWLHGRLRDLGRTRVFPELGGDADRQRAILSRVVERGLACGVRVYLYMTEPLALPVDHPFWPAHPDVRGVRGTAPHDGWPGGSYAMCSSHPSVLAFLEEGMADLFGACPGLGGVILINRSEHDSHCYSHRDERDCPRCGMYPPIECPRCARRPLADVIAEINNTIARGVHAASPRADVIAWNWAWPRNHDMEIVERTARDVKLMFDFERGGWKTIGGKPRFVDEYSLSYAGPSERFLRLHAAARRRGLDVFAKLQIGTTHELATVPNLPLIPSLWAKAAWLRTHEMAGFLGCWCFGNRLSLNTYAFNRFLSLEGPAPDDEPSALAAVAREYFNIRDASGVLDAWRAFAQVFDHYPFQLSLLYFGPMNYALAYPLPQPGDEERRMPVSWMPLARPFGTRLADTAQTGTVEGADENGFSLQDIRDAFARMAALMAPAVRGYEQALSACSGERAAAEIRNARVIQAVFESAGHIYAAYLLSRTEPFDRNAWLTTARDEIRTLEEVLPWIAGDSTIGFHEEAGSHFFTASEIREKLAELRALTA